MAYQTADVINLMEKTANIKISALAVDGGASANNLLLEFQADILGVPTERPECVETTALGAAYLAGLATGFYSSLDEIKENRKISKTFTPNMDEKSREALLKRWRRAVERSLNWSE